jgi:hypothetical protein
MTVRLLSTIGFGFSGNGPFAKRRGLVFALVYAWRQSLIAPIVMHFLQDFIVVVLIPFLHSK